MKVYNQYIDDVINGEILVADKIRKAVLRHVKDLKEAKKKVIHIILMKKWQTDI
jgi:hypothetical protein